MFARARAGGLGYGDVKKDLLARVLDYFGPMREKREALAKRPDDVEDMLADGARRAVALGAPVLEAARRASGLGRG
jgi:tryptophanyl-tRNA synthetase